jgi:hypothetical protein
MDGRQLTDANRGNVGFVVALQYLRALPIGLQFFDHLSTDFFNTLMTKFSRRIEEK